MHLAFHFTDFLPGNTTTKNNKKPAVLHKTNLEDSVLDEKKAFTFVPLGNNQQHGALT
jgi:hypothetical protein